MTNTNILNIIYRDVPEKIGMVRTFSLARKKSLLYLVEKGGTLDRFLRRVLARRTGIVLFFNEDGQVEMYHSVPETTVVAVFTRVLEALHNPIGTFIWHNN